MYPSKNRGGGGNLTYDYLHFTKKSSDDSYLKLLDFSKLLVKSASVKFFLQKFSLSSLTELLGHQVQK